MRHLHLDPVGGIAGDMFAACLLDALPELTEACVQAAADVSGAPCRLLRHHDDVLAGARFHVAAEHGEDHHAHVAWRDIRARLQAAPLGEDARGHAIGIFGALAEAEARVHGIAPEEVEFHEVGAVDSVADIVAAAVLIAAQGDARWSVGALPLGGGTIQTAHGRLPVPAPATSLLLEGFAVVDDGIGGERVTPTGAAILRWLRAHEAAPPGPRRLLASGIGFGTRRLPGLSNVLRVLVSETGDARTAPAHRELAVIAFEVDDQSPEDLATGLDRIRAVPGVHDAVQMPAFGKKGRIAAHVQVLVALEAMEAAVAACFAETTTIGLRTQVVQGRALPRQADEVTVGGRRVRRKRVERPGHGTTTKAESDDIAQLAGQPARERLRRAAEGQADE
jgi:uncharacterized protein (TIGR00299 family) protein